MNTAGIIKRNNVICIGEGERTLVLAHGFGCDQNMWRFMAPALVEDYRIVLFNYVGFGASDVSAFELADLEELLDLMDKNLIGWAQYLALLVAGGPAISDIQVEDTGVTVSIGVATDRSRRDFDALFQKVDQAMYQAKDAGRNTTCTLEMA
ncbi:MAG: alpha/beta fold hydrolase [Pseudomonadota bacterium]